MYVRPVELKGGRMLSGTHRYGDRDETKNFAESEAESFLAKRLGTEFLRADLFALNESATLLIGRKGRAVFRSGPARHAALPSAAHDKPRRRMITPAGRPWSRALGLTDEAGNARAAGRRKFLQIDRYIELLDGLLRNHPLPSDARILDVGSGRGGLTFALYDYLTGTLGMRPVLSGIELRPKLVQACNALAAACGYAGLSFEAGDIRSRAPGRLDMLIALHACDTATDQALAMGVRAGAEILVAAPCCHKQVRGGMDCRSEMRAVLKHGILAERQAEILTDGLRALFLEARGYRTEVFEFIATEHTPKNLMIAAVRAQPRPEAIKEAHAIMRMFGIERHELEDGLRDEADEAGRPGA